MPHSCAKPEIDTNMGLPRRRVIVARNGEACMFVRHKMLSLSIAAVGAVAWTGLGVASSAQAVTWTCAATKSATWGSGQVCKGSDGSWKLRDRDEATDGY